jgi:protein-S-isoprenylcysteine O-methyltransferase Ste14
MFTTSTILKIGGLLWCVSEIALNLFTRRKGGGVKVRDRASVIILWAAITIGFVIAGFLSTVRSARIPFPGSLVDGTGLLLFAGGLAIRWTAIITLGRFFTARVTIHQDHRIVRTGLFRYVRHPSYSGLFLACVGVALQFRNWLSLIAVMLPFFAALLYRMRVEEDAMVEALGADYVDYQRSTSRLIPGIF